MQCYAQGGAFDAVFLALYPNHPAPRMRSFNDARFEIQRFAEQIWVQVMATGDRASRGEMLGRMLRAHEELADRVSPPDSIWHSQNFGLLRSFATIGGLIFMTHCDLHASQRQVIELIPFFPEHLHEWLLAPGTGERHLRTLVQFLLAICWEQGVADAEVAGLQYIMLHLRAPPRHYQPGSCGTRVIRGRHAGEPRWPMRYAEHHTCTACPRARDADHRRYDFFRREGRRFLVGLPVFSSTVGRAYAREQNIIRTRRPLLTSTDMHDARAEREPPARNTGRCRPLQSMRRRLRRWANEKKLPPLSANFNVSTFLKQGYSRTMTEHPREAKRNYKSAYHRSQREVMMATGAVGPIRIADQGHELLVAEYGATPGKRLDGLLDMMKPEQMSKVARLTHNIRGPYRQTQLIRKLGFLLPERDVAAPRNIFVKVRRTCAWAKGAVAVIVRSLLALAEPERPEQAKTLHAFTKIIDGRTPKVSEAWINEYRMTDSFDLDSFEKTLAEPWLPVELATQKISENWDVARPCSRSELHEETWRSIEGWAFAARLPMSANVRRAAKAQLWHNLSALPDVAEELGPEDTMPLDHEAVATVRVDHNEHCMFRRSQRAQHQALYDHYVKDTRTFRRMRGWTSRTARLYLRGMYQIWYPTRYRRRIRFSSRAVPTATSRPKDKCWGASGLHCTRPNHIHERLVVSTAFMPMHGQDRKFCRGWELVKRNDGLPNFELWSLKDLRSQHALARGRLVRIPRFLWRCARCDEEKDGGCLARFDCNNMYTAADMEALLTTTAPRTLARYAEFNHRRTVTVEHAKNVVGKVGGSQWNTFGSSTFTHEELMQYLRYECRTNIFRLGSGAQAAFFKQIRGCAMGGRASKVKTSLLLGEGEGLFFSDPVRQAAERFAIPGYTLDQLVSLIRQIDDGAVASWVFCVSCLLALMQLLWSDDQEVSTEESGSRIRFCDPGRRSWGGISSCQCITTIPQLGRRMRYGLSASAPSP